LKNFPQGLPKKHLILNTFPTSSARDLAPIPEQCHSYDETMAKAGNNPSGKRGIQMTDLASKARHGRLAALRNNGAKMTNIFTHDPRSHAGNRRNVVMFLSRRSGSSGAMVE
jgi:hypothetical protein